MKVGILTPYDHRSRGDRAIIEAQVAWIQSSAPEAEVRISSPVSESNREAYRIAIRAQLQA